jgi:hypothetical protein
MRSNVPTGGCASFLMLVLVCTLTACADLTGPTGWRDNYGSHDLIAWNGQPVPTGVGADGGAVVKGCIMLASKGYTDTYTHQYTSNGQLKTQQETFNGTWEMKGDSIFFTTPTLTAPYSAKYDAEKHLFTLVWQNYKGEPQTFTYQRKPACR